MNGIVWRAHGEQLLEFLTQIREFFRVVKETDLRPVAEKRVGSNPTTRTFLIISKMLKKVEIR